ncbi:MAG: HIT domain-containing protein [Pseudomonadota bacterium]
MPIPAYDETNVFAKILRGDIPCDKVCENDHALAFRDISPQAKVHILVIPKKNYVSAEDFYLNASPEEVKGFFACLNEVTCAENISQQEGGQGFRLITNIGPDGGQEVPHFHIHILAGGRFGKLV